MSLDFVVTGWGIRFPGTLLVFKWQVTLSKMASPLPAPLKYCSEVVTRLLED